MIGGNKMGIKIIVDSASDMSNSESKHLKVLPLTVTFGDTQYTDGVNLTAREFYEKLVESDTLPKTSQVPPYDFEEAIEEVLAAGDTPIVVTVSSKLSGTYNSARIAVSAFDEKVYLIDSENVCIGERVLVEYGIRLIEAGKNVEEVVEAMEDAKKKICLIALLDTLEYLRKGGRVSNVAGVVGGMLAIKPVVGIQNGEIVVLGKARGSNNANNLLTTQIQEAGGIDFNMPYAVAYSGLDSSLADKYVEDQKSIWKPYTDKIELKIVGSTIGTHAGPGAIAVAYFKE